MKKLLHDILTEVARTCMDQAALDSCMVYRYDSSAAVPLQVVTLGTTRADTTESVLLNERILTSPGRYLTVSNDNDGHLFSEIMVPVSLQTGSVFLLYSRSNQQDYFTDHHLHILQTIGTLSAPLIASAMSMQDMQDQHDHEQAKEKERIRAELTDQLSHELRTSLTLIIGPLNKMVQDCNNPEELAQLESILTQARKLQNIANGMFDYPIPYKSRVDTGVEEPIVAEGQAARVDFDIQSKKPVVVIAEDSDQLRKFLNQILEDEFTLIEAANGLEGLQAAVENVPDLIISDIMMPEMDGLQLCEKIKSMEVTSHIPVLMLTALADLDSRLEGLETGADYYLGKPFEPRELLTASHNLIAQRKKLRDHFAKKLLVKTQEWQGASADERFLQKLMALVEEHLADPDFTIEELQKDMGISRMQLHRKLKALTDKSATEFIRTIRLKRAAEMLQKGQDNVSQVAYQVGFNSLSYFTKCFKEQFGVLPSAFS